jgi:broad specificity phosphatase PhoE
MKARRVALDGAQRRRIYLFRHGAVDYVDARGNIVDDPDDVPLSKKGRAQADAMRDLFAGVTVDRAVCSGLRRTRETAERVLGSRKLEIEIISEIVEIRAARGKQASDLDLVEHVAFSHWKATSQGSRFLGGEPYADFYARIAAAMELFTHHPDWHNLAIFAHGGTNAAILGWTSGLGLSAFGAVDQATCCLNVLDFDFAPGDQGIVRKIVRAMNVTADDPTKSGRHSGGMESLARRLMKFRE